MTEVFIPPAAVFLSYASEDAEAAARICEALRAAGVEVWFDRSELRGGDAWDSQIKKQIHDCALFVPLISAHTNARIEGYFRGEWNLATRRLENRARDAAFLMPVVIDETREADARVPEEFLRAQWTWLPGGETPPAFATRVRQLLGLDLAPVPSAKTTATGVVEPSTRSRSSLRPRNTPLVRRFGLPLIVLLLVLGGGASGTSKARAMRRPTEPVIAAAPSATAVAPNDKSIAVLPFADMSAGKDQEYFADGLSEELLNLLAKLPELRVIGRTSSFQFKGRNEDLRVIGEKLNVAHILEGSVRKSGEKLRISAQLIRAADSSHLWSQTYDRTLDDIFVVQDDIAGEVVKALKVTLFGTTSLTRSRPVDPEAYNLVLQARYFSTETPEKTSSAQSITSASRASVIRSYAPAWAGLSQAYAEQADRLRAGRGRFSKSARGRGKGAVAGSTARLRALGDGLDPQQLRLGLGGGGCKLS